MSIYIAIADYGAKRVQVIREIGTITDKDDTSKKGIVVTARVHPGETNSSWMMKGLLDFITGPSNTAKVTKSWRWRVLTQGFIFLVTYFLIAVVFCRD